MLSRTILTALSACVLIALAVVGALSAARSSSEPQTAFAVEPPTPTPLPGDLAVTKTDSDDPISSGDPFTYTVVVTNVGFSTVGGETDPVTGDLIPVEVIDLLPDGFALSDFMVDSGGSCIPAASDQLRCDFGGLEPGASATVTITGSITTTTEIVVENTVLVDLPISRVPEAFGHEHDNNFALEDTTVVPATPIVVGGFHTTLDSPDSFGGNEGMLTVLIAGAAAGAIALGGAAWYARRRGRS